MDNDPVEHPAHYTSHPSGIEVIEITQDMCFCVGNAWKYLARHDLKGKPEEDLRKALFYIDREIARRDDYEVIVAFSRPQRRPRGHLVDAWCAHEEVEWRRETFLHLYMATGEDTADHLMGARDWILLHLSSAEDKESR